jgi:Legionella pneumophila major outer membrane protein precursor
MGNRPDSGQQRRLLKAMRVLMAAVVCSFALLAAPSGVRAGEPSPVWKDGWTINVPGASNWVSDGTPSPFYLQSPPATPFVPGSVKDPYGFADYSLGHTLRFGQDYGLGNMQATLGVRMAEPLAGNGFTPAFDPRRYLGVGPRLGFEGNTPLQSSWVVEWHVGAAVLFGNRTFDTNGGVVNSVLPNYSNGGSVVNVDGLLGLSYWFDTASKLTVGYRADYFKGSPAWNVSGVAADNADRVNHGPMIRFSIQK